MTFWTSFFWRVTCAGYVINWRSLHSGACAQSICEVQWFVDSTFLKVVTSTLTHARTQNWKVVGHFEVRCKGVTSKPHKNSTATFSWTEQTSKLCDHLPLFCKLSDLQNSGKIIIYRVLICATHSVCLPLDAAVLVFQYLASRGG